MVQPLHILQNYLHTQLTRIQATLDELDDPAHPSDRAPLTGRITNQQAQANARSAGSAQGYLTSAISGEDRRAPMNTIDESVWETLRRDLLAVWEKMRQVLYPKYLLGGLMRRDAQGEGEAEGVAGALGHVRGLVGRLPDADLVLQGGMSEGLRDWDLWYVMLSRSWWRNTDIRMHRGPLLFCLLLSFLLSLNARSDQRSLVFSGVFATIWIAEAIVTLQIKLLGGNMYAISLECPSSYTLLTLGQFLLPIHLHHRLHPLSPRHRLAAVGATCADDCADTGVLGVGTMVFGGGRQHSGRQRGDQEPGGIGRVPAVCVLYWPGLPVLYFVAMAMMYLYYRQSLALLTGVTLDDHRSPGLAMSRDRP